MRAKPEAAALAGLDVRGTRLALENLGTGPPLLYLHGEDGTLFNRRFLEELAAAREVVVPSHPGWGTTPRDPHMTGVEDLAFFYLDALELLDRGPVPVVGSSVGAWIAADLATKCERDVSALVLVAPLGLRVGTRDEADFVDLFATSPDEVITTLYADPDNAPELGDLEDDDFLTLARAQEAMARFAWEPYLHSTKLAARLPRITVPTLVVWGSDDRFVRNPAYYPTYAERIGGNAVTHVVPGCGHRVDEEAPDELAQVIAEFLDEISG